MNVQRSSAIADNAMSVVVAGDLVVRGLAGAGVWGDEKKMTSAAVGGSKAFKGRDGRGRRGWMLGEASTGCALGPCGAVWKKAYEGTVSRGRRKRKATAAAFGGSRAFKGRGGAGARGGGGRGGNAFGACGAHAGRGR